MYENIRLVQIPRQRFMAHKTEKSDTVNKTERSGKRLQFFFKRAGSKNDQFDRARQEGERLDDIVDSVLLHQTRSSDEHFCLFPPRPLSCLSKEHYVNAVWNDDWLARKSHILSEASEMARDRLHFIRPLEYFLKEWIDESDSFFNVRDRIPLLKRQKEWHVLVERFEKKPGETGVVCHHGPYNIKSVFPVQCSSFCISKKRKEILILRTDPMNPYVPDL